MSLIRSLMLMWNQVLSMVPSSTPYYFQGSRLSRMRPSFYACLCKEYARADLCPQKGKREASAWTRSGHASRTYTGPVPGIVGIYPARISHWKPWIPSRWLELHVLQYQALAVSLWLYFLGYLQVNPARLEAI